MIPKEIENNLVKAQELFDLGLIAEARAAYEAMANVEICRSTIAFRSAQLDYLDGNALEAIDAIERSLKVVDSYQATTLHEASLFFLVELNDIERACELDALSGEIAPDLDRTAFFVQLAERVLSEEKNEQAYEISTDFLAQNPESSRGFYYLGLAQRRLCLTEKSRKSLLRSIELDPNHSNVWFVLALTALDGNDQNLLDLAVENHLRLKKRTTEHAQLLVKLGAYQEALSILENHSVTDDSRYDLALSQFATGNFRSAHSIFEMISDSYPACFSTTVMRARCLGCMGRLEEAVSLINENGESEEGFLELASLFAANAQFAKALHYCDRSISDSYSSVHLVVRSGILLALGLFEDAIESGQQAIAINRTSQHAKLSVAWALMIESPQMDLAASIRILESITNLNLLKRDLAYSHWQRCKAAAAALQQDFQLAIEFQSQVLTDPLLCEWQKLADRERLSSYKRPDTFLGVKHISHNGK